MASDRYEQVRIPRALDVAGQVYRVEMPAHRRRDDDQVLTNLQDEQAWRGWVARQVARSGDDSAEAFRFLREFVSPKANRFAEAIGVSPVTLSRWETGAREPNAQVFALLRAAALSPAAWRALRVGLAQTGATDVEREPMLFIRTRWVEDDDVLLCVAEAFDGENAPHDTNSDARPLARTTMRLEADAVGEMPAQVFMSPVEDSAVEAVRNLALASWRGERVAELLREPMPLDELGRRMAMHPGEVLHLVRALGLDPSVRIVESKLSDGRRCVQLASARPARVDQFDDERPRASG